MLLDYLVIHSANEIAKRFIRVIQCKLTLIKYCIAQNVGGTNFWWMKLENTFNILAVRPSRN